MALSYGHIVLRLPPYTCVLNPIEQVWSEVKRRVDSQNVKGRSVSELVSILKEAFSCVNVDKWKNYITHTENIENSYMSFQTIFDDDGDNLNINIDLRQSSSEYESCEEDDDF